MIMVSEVRDYREVVLMVSEVRDNWRNYVSDAKFERSDRHIKTTPESRSDSVRVVRFVD